MDENRIITKRARKSPSNLISVAESDDDLSLGTNDISDGSSGAIHTLHTPIEVIKTSSNDPTLQLPEVVMKDLALENCPKEFQWVAPQFKNLDLKSVSKEKDGNRNFQVKTVKLYVEALCYRNDDFGEILNLECHLLNDQELPSNSDSSGYSGDVSKTVSSSSTLSGAFGSILNGIAAKNSIRSHSSGSSVPSSASILNIQNNKKTFNTRNFTKEQSENLNKIWKNCHLVYNVVKAIDESFIELNLVKNITDIKPNSPPKKRAYDIQEKEEKNPLTKKVKVNPLEFESSMIVFARWTDQRYYAGYIKGQEGNKWIIKFVDGNYRNVPEAQIIFNDGNNFVGCKVMVLSDIGRIKYPGIVTEYFCENQPIYTIATDKGDFSVSAAKVLITKHQAQNIKNYCDAQDSLSCESPESSINVENKNSNITNSPKPCSSGMQKSYLTKTFDSVMKMSNSSDFTTMTDEDFGEINSEVEVIPGCDMELEYQRVNKPSYKLKSRVGKECKSSLVKKDLTLGPLHVKGNWFKGLGFLLTCGSRSLFDDCENETDIGTDNEDFPFSKIPFLKDHLENQIKNGGGILYSKFEDIPCKKYKNTFLVSWRPALTPKYIRGLAVGLKAICHEWIVNCSIKKKRLPLQELPSGWSVEDHRFIDWIERKSDKPFRTIRISIAQLTSKIFYNFWSRVCSDAGAIVTEFDGHFSENEIILVESGLTDPSLDEAQSRGLALVSTSWILQSLIYGEPRAYDKHPSYDHLYDDVGDLSYFD